MSQAVFRNSEKGGEKEKHEGGLCFKQRDKFVPPQRSGMIITIAIIVAVTSTTITQTR